MSRFDNRRWLVIPTDKIDDVNFSEVLEPNKESLRKTIDGTKTFIKYEVNVVEEDFETTYKDIETGEQVSYTTKAGVYGRPSIYSGEYTEYTYSEILELLSTEEWTEQIEE